jgi:hypothetical protein
VCARLETVSEAYGRTTVVDISSLLVLLLRGVLCFASFASYSM